jgi:hypothetical protein
MNLHTDWVQLENLSFYGHIQIQSKTDALVFKEFLGLHRNTLKTIHISWYNMESRSKARILMTGTLEQLIIQLNLELEGIPSESWQMSRTMFHPFNHRTLQYLKTVWMTPRCTSILFPTLYRFPTLREFRTHRAPSFDALDRGDSWRGLQVVDSVFPSLTKLGFYLIAVLAMAVERVFQYLQQVKVLWLT